ncbi:hypothetical protein [Falsiroseomonas sp.]|uniref:hypothetical protein n=1 Tax=Falsiroseomonas sp. TaxID=2870721 RepID=UPI003F72252A
MPTPSRNPYLVLGLSRYASATAIQFAFDWLSSGIPINIDGCYPQEEAEQEELRTAYEALMDQHRRADIDHESSDLENLIENNKIWQNILYIDDYLDSSMRAERRSRLSRPRLRGLMYWDERESLHDTDGFVS